MTWCPFCGPSRYTAPSTVAATAQAVASAPAVRRRRRIARPRAWMVSARSPGDGEACSRGDSRRSRRSASVNGISGSFPGRQDGGIDAKLGESAADLTAYGDRRTAEDLRDRSMIEIVEVPQH